MSNNMNKACAQVALEAYGAARGDTAAFRDMEDQALIVRDILADLMHLCEDQSIDFDNELDAARDHYEAEAKEDTDQ